VLLDAHVAGQFGGTGVKVDWTLAQQFVGKPAAPPTVLAGGLTPSNVAEAIVAVRPRAVDTASGVELSPGKKDAAAVQRFVAQARGAFAEIAPR
jgi:phosphoribosylanthranilate isomerase